MSDKATINRISRQADNDIFKAIIFAISPNGKKEATEKYQKKGADLRGLWEGYHFLEFGNDICEKVGVAAFDKAFESRGWGSLDDFRMMPSNNNGFTDQHQKSLKIFECFAGLLGISLLECFVEFLAYCQKNGLPLSHYSDDPDSEQLKKDIESIRKYIQSLQRENDYPPLTLHDQILLRDQINKVKERHKIYPYGKTEFPKQSRSELSQSLKDIEELLRIHPEHPALVALQVVCLIALERKAEAVDAVESAYKKYGNHVEILISYAKVLDWHEKTKEALTIIRKAQSLADGKNYSRLHHLAGIYLDKLGEYEEAINELKQAIAADKNFVHPYGKLARIYSKLNRHRESKAVLEKAVAIAPKAVPIVLDLARTLQRLSDDDKESIKLMLTLKDADLSEEQSVFIHSFAESDQGDFERSVAKITALIKAQENDPFATNKDRVKYLGLLANLFEVEYAKTNNKKYLYFAKEYYTKSLVFDPHDGNSLFRCAFYCFADGKYGRGEEYLDKIVKLNLYQDLGFDNTCDLCENFSFSLHSIGSQAVSQLRLFKWGLKKNPDSLICMTAFINTYRTLGKLKAACIYADRAILVAERIANMKLTVNSVRDLGCLTEVLGLLEGELPSSKGYWKFCLRILNICCVDQVRDISNELWLLAHEKKAELEHTYGILKNDVGLLIASTGTMTRLKGELLGHRDHDKWVGINLKLCEIFHQLWEMTSDLNYLNNQTELLGDLHKTLDSNEDREIWIETNFDLARAFYGIGFQSVDEKALEMSISVFQKILKFIEEPSSLGNGESEDSSPQTEKERLITVESLVGREKVLIAREVSKGEKSDMWVECNYYLGLLNYDLYEIRENDTRKESMRRHFEEVVKYAKHFYLDDAWEYLSLYYRMEGISNKNSAHFDMAVTAYENTLDLVQKDLVRWAKNKFGLGWLYQRWGEIFSEASHLGKSIKCYDLSAKAFEKTKLPISDYISCYFNQGVVILKSYEISGFLDEKLFAQCIRCYSIILKDVDNIENDMLIADSFGNRGCSYYQLGKHKRSKSLMKRAKDDCHRALSIFEKIQYQEGIERMGRLMSDIENLNL